MGNEQKVQYIVELLKQGSFKDARKEFEELEDSAKRSGATFKEFATSAKAAIVAIAGSALLRASINEFLEHERAINKLNTALKTTKQFSAEYAKELRGLADSLGEVTAFKNEEITNVIAKLIALGATKQQMAPLTETVLNLATLFDKDLNRAVTTVGSVMRGEFSAAEQLGAKFLETDSATQKYIKSMEHLSTLAGGQAREALSGLTGEVDRAKKQWNDFLELIGGKAVLTFAALANGIRAVGDAFSREPFKTGLQYQREELEKTIDLLVEQKKLAADAAALMKADLVEAFSPIDRSNGQIRPRDTGRQKAAIDAITLALPRPSPTPTAAPAAPDVPKVIKTLDAEEERKRYEQYMKDLEERSAMEMRMHSERMKDAAEERDLENAITEAQLKGKDLEMFKEATRHEAEIANIQQMKFEDDDRYNRLIELENQLHEVQNKRIADAHDANQEFNDEMGNIAEGMKKKFAHDVAGALVDAARGAKIEWGKFFADFLAEIAKAILAAMILRAIRGVFGYSEGGQSSGSTTASFATGGMILAANGINGVMPVNAPTFFPRFNVLAGEGGKPEVMTVLANPHVGRFNGTAAQFGTIKGRDMAILPKSALEGGGGAGGAVQILVTLSPELRAEIINESVRGAQVQVAEDMRSNTAIAHATKQLVS